MVQSVETLERSCVGQLHQTIDVANSIDVGDVGLEVLVDSYAFLGIFNAYIVEIQRFDVCTTTYGHQNQVAINGSRLSFFFKRDSVAILRRFYARCSCSYFEIDTFFLQAGA